MINPSMRSCSYEFPSHHNTERNMQRMIHVCITDAVLSESLCSRRTGVYGCAKVSYPLPDKHILYDPCWLGPSGLGRAPRNIRPGAYKERRLMKLVDIDHMKRGRATAKSNAAIGTVSGGKKTSEDGRLMTKKPDGGESLSHDPDTCTDGCPS